MNKDKTINKAVNKTVGKTVEKTVKDEPKTSDQEELLDQLDKIVNLLKAIDWKLWIYLKANKYIDDE